MVAHIDLIETHKVSIGANYEVIFRLCNAPNLTLFNTYSQIFEDGSGKIMDFRTQVLSEDTFRLYLNWDDFTDQVSGIYEYDVLFVSKPGEPNYRFYALTGNIELITRLTQI